MYMQWIHIMIKMRATAVKGNHVKFVLAIKNL